MNNEIVIVCGRKRTGKTRWMLKELRPVGRVLYIDPKGGEYNFGVICRTVDAVRDLTEKGTRFCVRVPTRSEEWASLLCMQALYVSKDGPVTVGIDELQRFSHSHGSVEGLYRLLEEGGWRGVSMIGTIHRPTDIEIDVLAAADRLICFQTHHSSDIKRIQHYIDIPDEVFMDLKQDEYIEWRVDWGRRFEIRRAGGKTDIRRPGQESERREETGANDGTGGGDEGLPGDEVQNDSTGEGV